MGDSVAGSDGDAASEGVSEGLADDAELSRPAKSPSLLTTGTSRFDCSPLPNVMVTGTKSPAVNEPVTGMPPSSARLSRPLRGTVMGSNDSASSVVPSAPESDSTVASSTSLFENEAMNVPLSSWPDTMTAPSTSTFASWLLTPAAGV